MDGKARAEKMRRIGGCIGGIVIVALMMLFFHPDGLERQGCLVLAILAGAIVWWICGVLPEYATAFLMVILFALVGGIPAQTGFAFFSNPIWWLLVGAFSIGLGMKETGLLERLALAIVSKFPASFGAQTTGFYMCGIILGPLIPSMVAKTSLLSPLALEISELRGYRHHSRESSGMFLATFTGVQTAAPVFISSSIVGYNLLAIYPAEVQAQFDFIHWFASALPWFIPMSILNLLVIFLLFRPRTGKRSESDLIANSNKSIEEKRAQLGNLGSGERRMAIIMAVTVLLWITQGVHGIPAWIPSVGALVAMAACGIVNKRNLGPGINWESLLFIGVIMGLGDTFNAAGITDWIVEVFTPAVMALASNPYLLVIGIALITIVMRFLIVSQAAFINVFLAFVIPIALTVGVSPWVIGFASYTVINGWFVKYQNSVYLAALYSVDEKMGKHSRLALYCVPYTVIAIICLLIAVPFWQMMGFI